MKSFVGITILTLSTIVCFAQVNRSLHFIKQLPSERNLLVLTDDSVVIDTMMECPGGDRLIDYFIKSKNQVSIIIQSFEQYFYYQFHMSDVYPLWTIDSMAGWAIPGYPGYLKNPNDPNLRARFGLQDFHTVLKIVDDTRTVMNLQSQKIENAQPPMHERELRFVIDMLSEDPHKDWGEIDSIFRNHIVITSSNSLRNFAFLMLVRKKEFLEKADETTLNYYASQFELMEYHYDIKFYIMFMKRLSSYWPPEQTEQYARNFYKKNTSYWEAKFAKRYWEGQETELKELKQLMRLK